MNKKYLAPEVTVEVLSDADILLASGLGGETPITDPPGANWGELKPL